MINPVGSVFLSFFRKIVDFLPDFFGGVLIIILGLVFASIIKKFISTAIRFLKIKEFLKKTKLLQGIDWQIWQGIFLETIRWIIILLFLVPALEIFRLPQAVTVINHFLFYLPNIIIAVIIAFVGLIVSGLVADFIKQSAQSLGSKSAKTLSVVAKTITFFFTSLVVLNQLGVAQDLIRILFTGIVAMIAIAGGLAFGLGGKELAKEILEEIKKSLVNK